MAIKINAKKVKGKAAIEMHSKDATEVLKEYEYSDVTEIPDNQLASVSYSAGNTKNLGNYEALKLSISVTIPCHVSEIEPAFKSVSKWADKELEKKFDELLGEGGVEGDTGTNPDFEEFVDLKEAKAEEKPESEFDFDLDDEEEETPQAAKMLAKGASAKKDNGPEAEDDSFLLEDGVPDGPEQGEFDFGSTENDAEDEAEDDLDSIFGGL